MRFSEEQVLAAGGNVDAARRINTALCALAESRIASLELDETLARSKVAWKFASLRQSLTYRLVDLGEATINEWSAGNLLASIVLARSFLETAALVHSIVKRLTKALANRDIGALDEIATRESFGARLKEWVSENGIQATNVLSALDDMSEEIDFMRNFYERMSETAHPNAFGVGQFYATIDKENIVVNYSRTKRSAGEVYGTLVVALVGAEWSVRKLRDYDRIVLEVAELHSEIDSASLKYKTNENDE
jgi:hypothetical protein